MQSRHDTAGEAAAGMIATRRSMQDCCYSSVLDVQHLPELPAGLIGRTLLGNSGSTIQSHGWWQWDKKSCMPVSSFLVFCNITIKICLILGSVRWTLSLSCFFFKKKKNETTDDLHKVVKIHFSLFFFFFFFATVSPLTIGCCPCCLFAVLLMSRVCWKDPLLLRDLRQEGTAGCYHFLPAVKLLLWLPCTLKLWLIYIADGSKDSWVPNEGDAHWNECFFFLFFRVHYRRLDCCVLMCKSKYKGANA